MDIETICLLSEKFRNAIEAAVHSGTYFRLNSLFHCFPKGCCDSASSLLAEFLLKNSLQPTRIKNVNGKTHDDEYGHTWLMIDDRYYLDITADQFTNKPAFKRYGQISECCCVPKNSYIYELFEISEVLPEKGIDAYGGDFCEELREFYNIIVRYIR